MNHVRAQQRIEMLRAKVDAMQPKEPPPLLLIKFSSEINPHAPLGTRACDDDDDCEWADSFVMVAPGYRGPLPEGVPTFDDWSGHKKGDDQ